MSNSEVISHFVDAFLIAPDFTIEALQLRLAHTGYQVTFKKSAPVRNTTIEDEVYLFPIATGERGHEDHWHQAVS